ncbi:NAD(P)-binding protein [Rhizodiscina lignyota]|uniref:NAD(P)-binding protein n=1 Tax=Rhizodiscina lignyota TaxID=1504668 RepID=A0A9P4IQQ5_9PEZI|nr:NAD(P)-binding protein [Rhizodiscina lignyota]
MASSPSLRVAVVGLNGTLAESIIKHLVAANFAVTGVTRDPSKATDKFSSSVKLVKADYDSVDTIAPILRGHDAVIDLINRNQWETSIRIIDAAIAAKVPFFVPSSWGLDQSNEEVRSLPPTEGKVKMEDYIIGKAKEGAIAFAAIETSMFLDWALGVGILIPLAGGQTRVYNDGNVKMSTSSREDIGAAVVTVLKKRESNEVRNRVLFMQSTVITQNQIVQYAREANPSKTWEVSSMDTEELVRNSWEAYNKGDRSPQVMRGFIAGGTYGKGLALFKHLDNDVLGIKEMSEQQVKDMVAKVVA